MSNPQASGADADTTGEPARPSTYSPAQLGRLAGVSTQTVQRWVDAGLVSAWRTGGGHRRIDRASADAYLSRLAAPAGARSEDGRRARSGPRPGPLRVLVVDDQPLQRKVLMLEVRHALPEAEVTEAAGAIEALVLIGRSSPDILVTDVVMPEVDGCRMIQVLQSSPHVDAPIIIAVSGYSQQELARMGKLPATVPILYRPFESDRLAELLRAAQSTLARWRGAEAPAPR